MGKQLERFVKAVVGDILKQDYPYLTSPATPVFRRHRAGAHGKALRSLRGAPGDASEQAQGRAVQGQDRPYVGNREVAGTSPGRIALELGVTERYVRILARQVKEQPKPQVQLRLW